MPQVLIVFSGIQVYALGMQEEIKPQIKKGKATELSQKIAEVLVMLRDGHHMSQRDFADRIGVSFQQYQKYEKGRDRISLEKAMLLCAHLGLNLDVFMEASDAADYGFSESSQTGFAGKPALSADEEELLALFARIPKKNKQNFLETIRQLAKMA